LKLDQISLNTTKIHKTYLTHCITLADSYLSHKLLIDYRSKQFKRITIDEDISL